MNIITNCFTLLCGTYIAFLLSEEKNNLKTFLRTHTKALLETIIVSFLPSFIGYMLFQKTFFSLPLIDHIIYEIGFRNMILTDFFEKNIYTIIPYGMICWKILSLLWFGQLYNILKLLVLCGTIYIIYRLIDYLFLLLLKKEAIGFGDIITLWAIGSYTDSFGVIITFLLGSIIGLISISIGLIIKKKKELVEIPFVPYLYLGYHGMIIIKEYISIDSLFYL
jgi:prepilin signal peptidase PulO-like enzyme (type II secretory pathway)